MEAPKPINNITFTEKSSMILKNNSSEFKLVFGTYGESIYFELKNIKIFPNIIYKNICTLNDLQKTNCWFNQFKTLDKLIKIINNMINTNKIQIKDEQHNNNNQYIYFVNPLDEDDIISIELKQKEQNQSDINNNLLQFIKEQKEKNIFLENKIDLIENKMRNLEQKIENLILENKTLKENIINGYKINKINNQYSLLDNSLIITNQDEVKLINSWIAPNKNLKYELLYRATRDGDTLNDFHKKCDNKSPIIVIGKTPKGYIFGGYTNIKLNYTKDEDLYDSTAFVFSLNQKKKFISLDQNRSIRKYSNYCIIFGNGNNSLQIVDRILSNNNHWSNPNGSYGDNLNLTEGQNFSIIELEIFHVDY